MSFWATSDAAPRIIHAYSPPTNQKKVTKNSVAPHICAGSIFGSGRPDNPTTRWGHWRSSVDPYDDTDASAESAVVMYDILHRTCPLVSPLPLP